MEETTNMLLYVNNSSDENVKWDRSRIVNALNTETSVPLEYSVEISHSVEDEIKRLNPPALSTSLIRELVNIELSKRGFHEARKSHARYGLPLSDIEKIITNRNNENSNVSPSPEASNLTLAETLKKQYALAHVFPASISNLHINGDIHIHDLGFIDRVYCGSHSIEYVKKFGLNLPNGLSSTKPAKHIEVLIAHMVKFLTFMQTVFAGAVAYDAVNMFLAPFLVYKTMPELEQIAQILIYELSQSAVARGGQAIFSDINIYWEIPNHFKNTPAIGPGGKFTGYLYKDYLLQSQNFAKALFNVYLKGDANGAPFFFPKPLLHITPNFFETHGWASFLEHVCKVSSVMGSPYFVFDRDGARVAQCCRLKTDLGELDLAEAKEPWKSRFCALQNVTINLPRIAYQCKGNKQAMFEMIDYFIPGIVEAHLIKRDFIKKLLNMGGKGPLSLLSMDNGEGPYLRLDRASYLVGMVGLDEMVEHATGHKMHESEESFKFGLEMISYLKLTLKSASAFLGNNINFKLEQTPAESTALRFAALDLKAYPEEAKKVVKGDINTEAIYYTNSTHLNLNANISCIERIKKEGMFHPLIEAGAISHVWLGESKPDPVSLASLVIKTYNLTNSEQIAFSPEFTLCNSCSKTSRGLHENCPYCKSDNVDGMTRITGYFSKTSIWNKGKLSELKDRVTLKQSELRECDEKN